MKQNTAAIINPVLGKWQHHADNRAPRPTSQGYAPLQQAVRSIFASAECLQNNNQMAGSASYSRHDGAKFRVQHDIGAKPDIAKHGVDHTAFCQNHIPRKYPDKIACEKRNNQQKHSPAAGVFRHPEMPAYRPREKPPSSPPALPMWPARWSVHKLSQK